MRIPQFIYTKMPPEQSPWKKAGFHAAYYPLDLLARKDVLDLEARIHYPPQATFARKRTVFFLEIQKTVYQIIIAVTPQPDARDEFGRGGVFLAHGFLLPPDVWRALQTPLDLWPLLEQHVATLEQVPGADPATGNLEPLTLPDLPPAVPQPQPLGPAEKQLLCVLYKIAFAGDPALSVKGDVPEVEALFNKLTGCFPAEVRRRLGWDAAFDGGKIFFFPLKVVGFSQLAPTTGDPFVFNLSSAGFQHHDQLGRATAAQSFYERWLTVLTETPPLARQENHYAWAAYLEGRGERAPIDRLPDDAFIQANNAALRQAFAEKSNVALSDVWAGLVAEHAAVPTLLRALGGQPEALGDALQEAILTHDLSPKKINAPLPERIAQAGGPLLRLLAAVWKNAPPPPTQINAELRAPFLRYLVRARPLSEVEVLKYLQQFPAELEALQEEPAFKPLAVAWLKGVLSEPYRAIAAPFGEFLVTHFLISDALGPNADWPALLEEYLLAGTFSEQELNKLLKAKWPHLQNQYLLSFLKPAESAEAMTHPDERVRARYLQALVENHRYGEKELKAMGWRHLEIEQALRRYRKGFIRRLFR